MAVFLGKGIPCFSMNEQIDCFPRNSSSIATSNLRVSRISASIGMNLRLRGCVGNNSYRLDSVRNCGLRGGDKGLDCGGGFGKMKAIRMNRMQVYEVGLHQENKSGSSLLFPNGHSFQEKLVVAVDVDEVLGNFVTALNRFIADRYSSNHSVSEYHVYEFFKSRSIMSTSSSRYGIVPALKAPRRSLISSCKQIMTIITHQYCCIF